MAYRRRTFRRRNGYRGRRPVTRRRTTVRTRRPRTTVRTLSRRVARISRNFQPEFKFQDYNMNTVSGVAVPESVWAVTASANLGIPGIYGSADPQPGYMALGVPGLDEGTSQLERVGSQVLYRSLHVTGIISAMKSSSNASLAANDFLDMSGHVKIMVLLDKQARMGIDTDPVPQFFAKDVDGDYSTASRRMVAMNKRYTVIASRKYSIQFGSRPSVDVNIYIPMRRVFHWGSGDSEHNINQMFKIVALASPTLTMPENSQVSPVFVMRLQCRVRYVDC